MGGPWGQVYRPLPRGQLPFDRCGRLGGPSSLQGLWGDMSEEDSSPKGRVLSRGYFSLQSSGCGLGTPGTGSAWAAANLG